MGRLNDRDLALESLMLALRSEESLVPAEGRIGFLRARAHGDLVAFGGRLSSTLRRANAGLTGWS